MPPYNYIVAKAGAENKTCGRGVLNCGAATFEQARNTLGSLVILSWIRTYKADPRW
jgi:hypothetical protein